MIFRPELARMVREGRKTQTRRIVQPGKDCTYQPGRVVPVQPGRGKRAMARVTVVELEQQELGAISERDARAEGFLGRQQFFAYWRSLHRLGLRVQLRDLLERLVDAPAGTSIALERLHPGLPISTVRARLRALASGGFVERLEDGTWDVLEAGAELLADELEGIDLEQPVWAISFRLSQTAVEVPTYLTPTLTAEGRLDGFGRLSGGYTTRVDLAMREAPGVGAVEVMDTELLHVSWRTVSIRQHEEAIYGGTFDERLSRARALAQQRNIDIGDLERMLEDRFKRVVAKDPERLAVVLERRVRAIENRVKKPA